VRFLFIGASLVLTACSSGQAQRSSSTQIEPLSTSGEASNAGKLRQLVDQQCFDRLDDLQAFETALKGTGWRWKRTQTADPDNRLSLDVWELPGVTLIRGQPVKDGVWTCTVAVNSPVAPPADRLANELSKTAKGVREGSDGWWWNRSQANRIHMDLTGSAQGVTINVENYHLPWWRSFLE
jgi:hypothetical protein